MYRTCWCLKVQLAHLRKARVTGVQASFTFYWPLPSFRPFAEHEIRVRRVRVASEYHNTTSSWRTPPTAALCFVGFYLTFAHTNPFCAVLALRRAERTSRPSKTGASKPKQSSNVPGGAAFARATSPAYAMWTVTWRTWRGMPSSGPKRPAPSAGPTRPCPRPLRASFRTRSWSAGRR